MNIGTDIINSKDKNAECGVCNTKNSTSQIKKKISLFTGFYNNIQRPIKRESERERERGRERRWERQREIKGE